MTFVNCLKTDFRRSIFSFRFLISVIGYSILLYANLPIDPWPTDAVYLFSVSYKYGFYIFFFLCAAIPYSTSYLKDIENGYIKSVVLRIPSGLYGLSKCIATVVSGMISVALSTAVFIAALSIRFRSGGISSISFSGWDILITKYSPAVYFAVKTILTALYGGCFALLALVASTRIHNSFVILALPVLIYYAINELSILLKAPLWCNFSSLLYVPVASEKLSLSFLYMIFIFLILFVLLYCIFILQLRRLHKNGYCQ